MSYRKQKKLSPLPTRSDGLASFLLISFHRCCPLSFGEAHFCRRRRSQKAITSDQRGFAGVQPPHHALTSRQRLLVGGELVMRVLNFGWSSPRRCLNATDLILMFFTESNAIKSTHQRISICTSFPNPLAILMRKSNEGL